MNISVGAYNRHVVFALGAVQGALLGPGSLNTRVDAKRLGILVSSILHNATTPDVRRSSLMLRSGALFGAFSLLLGRVLLHTMTFARISKACDEHQNCDLYLRHRRTNRLPLGPLPWNLQQAAELCR